MPHILALILFGMLSALGLGLLIGVVMHIGLQQPIFVAYNLSIATSTTITTPDAGIRTKPYTQKAVVPLFSQAFLVVDLDTGEELKSEHANERLPIASITKLMTALVVLDQMQLDHIVTIPRSALVYTSKPRFSIGQQISVLQLLYPLLTESSNEAARALAYDVGNDRFVRLMNDKAATLGMSHTHFSDPSGASKENVSTAEDLALLAKYIVNNQRFVFDITAGMFDHTGYEQPMFTDLKNFNLFSEDPTFVGGKIGKTNAAHETMLAVFTQAVNGQKHHIAFVVLGTDDIERAINTLRSKSL